MIIHTESTKKIQFNWSLVFSVLCYASKIALSLLTSLPRKFKCKYLLCQAEENYCSHSHWLQLHASRADRKEYEVWSKSSALHSFIRLIMMLTVLTISFFSTLISVKCYLIKSKQFLHTAIRMIGNVACCISLCSLIMNILNSSFINEILFLHRWCFIIY